MLRRISVRQATAYLLYLVTNASLFNLTKVQDEHDPNHLLHQVRYEPCFLEHLNPATMRIEVSWEDAQSTCSNLA